MGEALLIPTAVTLGTWTTSTGGSAVSCLWGSGKNVEEPTLPAETTFITSSGSTLQKAYVSFEIPTTLKEAIEQGKKLLEYKIFSNLKESKGKGVILGVGTESGASYGNEAVAEGTSQKWLNSTMNSTSLEAINSLSKLEGVKGILAHAGSLEAVVKVFEIYVKARWEDPSAGVRAPAMIL